MAQVTRMNVSLDVGRAGRLADVTKVIDALNTVCAIDPTPVRLESLYYENPIDATLVAAAGAIALSLLKFVRDWKAEQRSGLTLARREEAVTDFVKKAVDAFEPNKTSQRAVEKALRNKEYTDAIMVLATQGLTVGDMTETSVPSRELFPKEDEELE